ncbi:DNA adenine methylase [Lactobacillus amylolyticus]|uniref:DNA adenine methylase n=1 Tax=Lactobacillus amylolyticus TaxID=83683 RepID=UPI002491BDDB|nr:DNA adenine methylase [Lactobacillus amylolyticus]
MRTKDITEKYHITRQSINNWERFDGLKTKRTGTNRLIWDNESISWLDKFIKQKVSGSVPSRKSESFNIQNRRYLGSKLRLLDFIKNVTEQNTKNVKTIADVFGGTGVVANMFFQNGENVIVNDILDSNLVSYETFFGSEDIDEPKIQTYIQKMNRLPLRSNYVSDNYGDKYFSADNAKKIGEAREYIERLTNINGRERAVLLTSLIYAMDKSANTVGHYDAYRKKNGYTSTNCI